MNRCEDCRYSGMYFGELVCWLLSEDTVITVKEFEELVDDPNYKCSDFVLRGDDDGV